MEITKEENNILVNELIEALQRPILDEKHEITVKMLTDQSGKTSDVCRNLLESKVANEGWLKHTVLDNTSHPVTAYYCPKKWKPV